MGTDVDDTTITISTLEGMTGGGGAFGGEVFLLRAGVADVVC